MQPIDQFIPVTRAKASLLDLVRKAREQDRTIAITRNGVPEVVLMSLERFDGMLETIEILADHQTTVSLRRSMAQAEAGQWIEGSDLLRDD
jgi:prevent-host-death family protein